MDSRTSEPAKFRLRPAFLAMGLSTVPVFWLVLLIYIYVGGGPSPPTIVWLLLGVWSAVVIPIVIWRWRQVALRLTNDYVSWYTMGLRLKLDWANVTSARVVNPLAPTWFRRIEIVSKSQTNHINRRLVIGLYWFSKRDAQQIEQIIHERMGGQPPYSDLHDLAADE